MARYYAVKVKKDVWKQMDALQRTLWRRADKAGRRGCDLLELLNAVRPYNNEYGNPTFATIETARNNVGILKSHGVLIRK